MEQYLEAWQKYAVFTGRATRKDYWMFFLVHLIICIFLGIIAGAMESTILSNIYNLAVFLPSLGIGIRRMHDTNRSGWWLLAPVISLIFLCEPSSQGNNKYN